MIIDLATFTQHAAACAPSVHVETLAAVAKTESGFNTLAIGDNTAKRSYSPKTAPEAIRIAKELIGQGHSVDLGLMQINSANLRGLAMSVEETFQPCPALRGGARVLIDGYKAPPAGQDPQPALIRALSHYNTGNPQRGVANGYVGRVMVSAQAIVPALRLGTLSTPAGAMAPAAPSAATTPAEPAPPPWDVYGRAKAGRVTITAPPPSPAPVTTAPEPKPAAPVVLRLAAEDGQ